MTNGLILKGSLEKRDNITLKYSPRDPRFKALRGMRHWGKETSFFTVTGVGTVRHWGKIKDRLRIEDLFRTAPGAVKTY